MVERSCREMGVAGYNVLALNLIGRTEEKHGKPSGM
jgi:hypothetical protein